MTKRSQAVMTLVVITILVAGMSAWLYWQQGHNSVTADKVPVETLDVGAVSEFSMLVFAAQRQGYFQDNNLDIKVKKYPTGVAAFQGLQKKEVDISAAADFVGVRASFDSQDFKIIASIMNTPELFRIVARQDKGIQSPADLKGKKIGLTKKTAGEFFLSTFLTFHNLLPSDVEVIDGEPPELTRALVGGEVDAVISARYHTYQIAQQLGKELAGNARIFPAQDRTLAYQLLYANQPLTQERPDAIRRFIQALIQAEDYLRTNPSALWTMFADELDRPKDYTAEAIEQFRFKVSLNQAMILAMEDAARWHLTNNSASTSRSKIPNYLDYTYFDGLEKVRPDAITIIR